MSQQDAIAAMLGAAGCEDSFEANPHLHRALCNTPQPRWIGAHYFECAPCVCVVLINPGGGGSSPNPALAQEADFFRDFYREGNYDAVRSSSCPETRSAPSRRLSVVVVQGSAQPLVTSDGPI